MNTHHFFIIPETTEKVISYDLIRKHVYGYDPENVEHAFLDVMDRHDNLLHKLQPVSLLDILEDFDNLVGNKFKISSYAKEDSKNHHSFIFVDEDSVEAFNEIFVHGEEHNLAKHLPNNQIKIKNILATKVGNQYAIQYEDGSDIIEDHPVVFDAEGIEDLQNLKEGDKFAAVSHTIFHHCDWAYEHSYDIVNVITLKDGQFKTVRDFVHTISNEDEEPQSTTITPKDGSEMTPEQIKEIILGHVELSLDDIVDFNPASVE